jgi:hypothetical protein
MDDIDKLKLIYVLKIGYNTKGEGQYEFVFAKDETNIDPEKWCWDLDPAADNAMPPEEEYIDKITILKTKKFDLFCLHEAYDRPYIHGYHLIHALAYEVEYEGDDNGYDDYEHIFSNESNDELPLLVFHYGMTLKEVKNLLYSRNIILKNDNFIETSKVKIV